MKQEIIKCKKEVKRFSGNGGGSIGNNHPRSRAKNSMQQQQQAAPPSPSRIKEEGDVLVPFPDRSSDPVHSVLSNQPHPSQAKAQPKRRMPRLGKCWGD